MNEQQIAGLVRHILTAAGGYLVSKGVIDEATLTATVGAIITLGGVAWSFWAKRNTPSA